MEEQVFETAQTEAPAGVANDSVPDTAPFWDGASMEDKLSYAASIYGVPEEALVDGLLRQSGDAGEGWQVHLDGRRHFEQEELTGRLAAEFEELRAQVSDIREVDDVPYEVMETALSGKATLLDAYLRGWYRDYRDTEAQRRSQQQAAEAATGSLAGEFDEPDPKETAFSRAFHTALA